MIGNRYGRLVVIRDSGERTGNWAMFRALEAEAKL